MKITRSELRAIINESIFNISQSPVLQKLGVRTPAEREKIKNCKQAAMIINNLGLSPSRLLRELQDPIVESAKWYYKYKRPLGPGSLYNPKSIVRDYAESFIDWFTTEAKALKGGRRMRQDSIGVEINDQFFNLVPLLHNISRPGLNVFPVQQAFKKDPLLKTRPEELDPARDYSPEIIDMQREREREAMTNLELEFDITLPGDNTILQTIFAGNLKNFERFLTGVSKCSAANGGPNIDGVAE